MSDILLIEPNYKNKYPPLGLMKISYFHKHIHHDYVRFAKGRLPEEFDNKKWDRVYVTTLFTFEWEETKKSIEYALKVVKDTGRVYIGGIMSTLMPELFAEHLKLYEGKAYEITPLLDVIDKVINQIKENFSWGYSVEYYLSAANCCTPSYASYFYKKHMLSISQVAELLDLIAEEKKISFDKNYAEELYYTYNAKAYNDESDIKKLAEIVRGKRVLLVAPGRSVER
jgi:hypothetical protein